MKKVLFMAGAVLMSAVCLGQVKDVKKAQSFALQENPDFKSARELINGAKVNAETMSDANTWYVAGLIGYQESENEYNKRYFGNAFDYNIMGAAQEESYINWLKADELACILVQDKKGNMVMDKKNSRIRSNIAAKLLDYWNNQGLLAYAGSFYENGDYARTFDLYKMYVEIPNLSVMQDEKIQAKMVRDTSYQELVMNAGMLAYSAEKFQDAIEIFSKMLKGDYKAVTAGEYLYSCYLELGDSARAYEIMDECIIMFPAEERFLQARINAYVAQKDYDNAVVLLDKAIAADPQAQYYNSKGSILSMQGKYEEAIAAFEAGVALDPNNSDLYTNYGYVFIEKANKMNEEAAYMSDAEYKKVRKQIDALYKQALPLFEKGYALNPENMDCVRALRSLYYRLGMEDKYEALQ